MLWIGALFSCLAMLLIWISFFVVLPKLARSPISYVAKCQKCGHIVKKFDTLSFMDVFLLPDCPKCGNNDTWKIEAGDWQNGEWVVIESIIVKNGVK